MFELLILIDGMTEPEVRSKSHNYVDDGKYIKCTFGCGCWSTPWPSAGGTPTGGKRGGPKGIDPWGPCPNFPAEYLEILFKLKGGASGT